MLHAKEVQDLRVLENTLKQIRGICLGQNVPMFVVMPPHVRDMPVEYRVTQVVDQLMFSLTAVSFCDPNELKRAESWLTGLVKFLLTSCNEDDQTFFNIAKLFRLPIGIRQCMFEEPFSVYSALRNEATPPVVFECFDEAVFYLLNSCGKAEQAKEAIFKLNALLLELK